MGNPSTDGLIDAASDPTPAGPDPAFIPIEGLPPGLAWAATNPLMQAVAARMADPSHLRKLEGRLRAARRDPNHPDRGREWSLASRAQAARVTQGRAPWGGALRVYASARVGLTRARQTCAGAKRRPRARRSSRPHAPPGDDGGEPEPGESAGRAADDDVSRWLPRAGR